MTPLKRNTFDKTDERSKVQLPSTGAWTEALERLSARQDAVFGCLSGLLLAISLGEGGAYVVGGLWSWGPTPVASVVLNLALFALYALAALTLVKRPRDRWVLVVTVLTLVQVVVALAVSGEWIVALPLGAMLTVGVSFVGSGGRPRSHARGAATLVAVLLLLPVAVWGYGLSSLVQAREVRSPDGRWTARTETTIFMDFNYFNYAVSVHHDLAGVLRQHRDVLFDVSAEPTVLWLDSVTLSLNGHRFDIYKDRAVRALD